MKKQFKATLRPKTYYVKAESAKAADAALYIKARQDLPLSYAKECLPPAEEKRLESLRSQVYHSISAQLLDFKCKFVEGYVEYLVKREERNLEAMEKRYAEKENPTPDDAYYLQRARNEVKRMELKKVHFYAEADQAYEERLNRLCNKVIEMGDMQDQVRSFLEIKYAKVESYNDFSFLAIDRRSGMEIHARVIFACGEVNAPHYRFIVTKRK